VDNVSIVSDSEPDFSECGSGSRQKGLPICFQSGMSQRFESIFEKALTRESGTQTELFGEKTEVENLVTGFL
jgi:hypothetical protein